MISLIVFAWASRIKALLFDGNKIDIVKHNLAEIAQYVSVYNPESSKIIARTDQLIQAWLSWDDVLNTHTSQIELLWDDIIAQQHNLSTLWWGKYGKLIQLITDLRPTSQEILTALGKDKAQYYLVILQNSSERRPNGWFFWSFALITVRQGAIKNFKILDSYFPQKYMPNAAIRLPDRSHDLYPSDQTNWIAANKFGFHDMDGKTLIALYDETFNQPLSSKNIPPEFCRDFCDKQIAGVIFVRTDTIDQLIPEFKRKQRERQFLNANIDIIRGKNLPNKKEKYLSDVKKLVEEKKWAIVKQFINKFDLLTQEPNIGIYLPKASPQLQSVLAKYKMITLLQWDKIYLRDTNTSYNKIDEFVHKKYTIQDKIGDVIQEWESNIVSLSGLQQWVYTLTISYTTQVPDQYKNYIFWLETQYGIKMTDRERGILALEATDNYDDQTLRLRSTKWQIYYPNTVSLIIQGWDGFWFMPFRTPWWQGLQYNLKTANNGETKTLVLQITKK